MRIVGPDEGIVTLWRGLIVYIALFAKARRVVIPPAWSCADS